MSMPIETIIDDDATLADSQLYWRERGGVKVLVSSLLEDVGFANGFSTRMGGVSDFPEWSLNLAGFNEDSADKIYENRRRFLTAFDGEYELALAWQVHGDVIRQVATDDDVGDSERRADAIISDLDGVLAAVKTADCVPVLIGDTKTKAFAAVHAGWRGTVQSIVTKTIETMRSTYASNPKDLVAAIGPAAGCTNYEIGEDVMAAFAENFPYSDRYFSPTRDGHALVDLHQANRDQLIASGVEPENISAAPFCTMERPDLFFSYRLEKQKFGKTGRLLSVIGRAA